MMQAKLPLGEWAEEVVHWLASNIGFLFDFLRDLFGVMLDLVNDLLTYLPPFAMIALIAIIALFLTRKILLSSGVAMALILIYDLGLWSLSMETLSLVLVSAAVAIAIGLPIGIMCSRNNNLETVTKVVLDFMQTMPSFVYLIPVVIFFGLGNVPGMIATIVFALPPTVRMTNLGIRQVPRELNEVADSFGTSPLQKLVMVQLPVAMPTIKAGINQCVMLSLSMVVIASMIGAGGLGRNVLIAIQRIDIGLGFEAGLAIVIIAIVLDRISQNAKTRS